MRYDNFFNYFEKYKNYYVLIGGNATSILLEQQGFDARGTEDYDIIVIFEKTTQEFINHFKNYLLEYSYKLDVISEQADGVNKHYYRFNTERSDVPRTIELFSKEPIDFRFNGETGLIIPLEDEDDSLSAISLDRGYYELLSQGVEIIDGMPILKPAYLILFKAKAQLDIDKRRKDGKERNHSKKNKHTQDIFRLSQLIETDEDKVPSNSVSVEVKEDFDKYMSFLKSKDDLGRQIKSMEIEGFLSMSNKEREKLMLEKLRSLFI